MPPPPPNSRQPDPRPAAGRHRRPQPPSRVILLGVLAVLTVLLGSGTAISLTAATPAPSPPPATSGPETAALGSAPATPTASPSPSPSPSPPEREPAPEPEPEPEPPAPPEEAVDEVTSLENEVTRLTNAEREDAGCDALGTDERLRGSARGHSQDMAANDYFDHTGLDGRSPFDRMADAGHPDPAAENIASGYRTPAEVMDGWMNSDGHRDNILNCSLQAIGVGLAYDGNGRPYWTQNFGR